MDQYNTKADVLSNYANMAYKNEDSNSHIPCR